MERMVFSKFFGRAVIHLSREVAVRQSRSGPERRNIICEVISSNSKSHGTLQHGTLLVHTRGAAEQQSSKRKATLYHTTRHTHTHTHTRRNNAPRSSSSCFSESGISDKPSSFTQRRALLLSYFALLGITRSGRIAHHAKTRWWWFTARNRKKRRNNASAARTRCPFSPSLSRAPTTTTTTTHAHAIRRRKLSSERTRTKHTRTRHGRVRETEKAGVCSQQGFVQF